MYMSSQLDVDVYKSQAIELWVLMLLDDDGDWGRVVDKNLKVENQTKRMNAHVLCCHADSKQRSATEWTIVLLI